MSDPEWRAVSVVDNENMMVPHVLEQLYHEGRAQKQYRLRSINELPGVDDR